MEVKADNNTISVVKANSVTGNKVMILYQSVVGIQCMQFLTRGYIRRLFLSSTVSCKKEWSINWSYLGQKEFFNKVKVIQSGKRKLTASDRA